ncbi:nitrite reductase small subunit NirD [Acidithiobacillus caldus]
MQWFPLGKVSDVPSGGGRYAETPVGQIAVLCNEDGELFAVHNHCPHRGGPLSEGFVSGKTVFCPLHNWQIDLESGKALPPDQGCVKTFLLKTENDEIWLGLPESAS